MLMLLQGKQKLILPPDPEVEKRGKKERMTDQNVESVVDRSNQVRLWCVVQPMDLYRVVKLAEWTVLKFVI